MSISVFNEKKNPPTEPELKAALKKNYPLWIELKEFVIKNYQGTIEQWNSGGLKHGWSFRLRDKKRAIVYFIPCDGYFKVAMVFGEKATNDARNSKISTAILDIIESATVYAEGRGFRIDINGATYLEDIKKLILIKLNH
jgi:hypothetical protein